MKIVYNSNTGTTEKYAKALAEKLECEAVPFSADMETDEEVIFMSWVQMGEIVLLSEARAKFNIRAVVAVGVMSLSDESKKELIEKNAVAEPFVLLPGAFFINKLSGMYKMVMKMALSMMKGKAKKSDDPKDMKALEAMENGIDLFDESKLDDVVFALNGGSAEEAEGSKVESDEGEEND